MNFRVDGREREDYRPMELELDVVSHAFGSARLRLANTDVLVAVKIEVDTPFPERPLEGKIEFFVDWYALLVLILSFLCVLNIYISFCLIFMP